MQALTLHAVDVTALVTSLAHAFAHMLLVDGLYHADPHGGNLFVALDDDDDDDEAEEDEEKEANNGTASDFDDGAAGGAASNRGRRNQGGGHGGGGGRRRAAAPRLRPVLLDWGMAVSCPRARRLAYCALFASLSRGDVARALGALRDLGYETTQSGEHPERDVEFFAYVFRDTGASSVARLFRRALRR